MLEPVDQKTPIPLLIAGQPLRSATILAIASSGERNSVALLSATRQVAHLIDGGSGAGSSAEVFAQFDTLLAKASLRRDQIDVIAFDQGPGAFTGVRLACSIAQALGFGLGRPLLAISSLEVIAARASALRRTPCAADELIWVTRDARMGEVYCASYTNELELADEASVLPIAHAARWLSNAGKPLARGLAAGNGFSRFPELREAAQVAGLELVPEIEPDAADLALLARLHWQAGRQIPPGQASPAYVRDKVALDLSEQGRRK